MSEHVTIRRVRVWIFPAEPGDFADYDVIGSEVYEPNEERWIPLDEFTAELDGDVGDAHSDVVRYELL